MVLFCRSSWTSFLVWWVASTVESPTVTRPFVGTSRKLVHLKRVVFPEPDGPNIHTISPVLISKLTPFKTSRSPNTLRKDYDHDDLQIFCRKDQVQSGSKDGTDDGIDPGNDSCKTVNMSAFYKFEKRGETSQKTGALIGPGNQMNGKSGKHKGWQSEKPAASGYGVNDSGKEECYAYDYKRRHVQFHGRLP